MKRFAPLALIVLALALVPAALADTTPPSAQPGARSNVQLRLQIMRLRVQIVKLRFELHCGAHGKAPQDRCVAFAQKVEDRLTAFDGNVQKKIGDLQSCTADSPDAKCKSADKKITMLQKIDARVQTAIANVQKWLDGKTSTSATSDSSLDQAAADLGQAATGANG
jgi:hypothetical protein